MKVLSAEFVMSAPRADGLPYDGLPQVAFVGRSNVGKSSLINALTRLRVARTSATPGKTRLLNLYRLTLGNQRRLDFVDLPGYGFSRGPEEDFDTLVTGYWQARQQEAAPTLCVLAVDARHPGLAPDAAAWQWIGQQNINAIVVATKSDKLSGVERARHLREFDAVFHAPVSAVSAARGEGLDELWKLILKHLPR